MVLRQCVQRLQGQGHPELSQRGPGPTACPSRRDGGAAGEAWKQVAVQETEKPELLRRILSGCLGMRMQKPAGEGIGQPRDVQQMC